MCPKEKDDQLEWSGPRSETGKKPYTPPQLFRVEITPEQAILTACSLTTTSAFNGGNRSCRGAGGGQCKNRSGNNGDSGPRQS
ncbi:MAG: hypothetical protein Q8N00_08345 [Nitrospirota bacterium]|nr:hypothetical protein [Nitrospirota bacterium]MDP3596031.1 hypothetical protein [Nitrospirota bacterium]